MVDEFSKMFIGIILLGDVTDFVDEAFTLY